MKKLLDIPSTMRRSRKYSTSRDWNQTKTTLQLQKLINCSWKKSEKFSFDLVKGFFLQFLYQKQG